MIELQYKAKVKGVRSDNALELKFTALFKKKGILAYHSCPERPEHNSVVERKHQHILNVARALMFQSHLSLDYWGDSVLTAVFLINRTPTQLLKNKSPYEILMSKAPDYSGLKVFGCLAYMSTSSKNRHKFQPRSKPCVFLGYPVGYKGYKLLDLKSHQVHISRNVVFHETIFPFSTDQNISLDGFFSKESMPHSEVSNVPIVSSESPAAVISDSVVDRSKSTIVCISIIFVT